MKEALRVPYFKHSQQHIQCAAGTLARGGWREKDLNINNGSHMVPLICKLVSERAFQTTRKKKNKKKKTLSQARFLIKKLARGVFVSLRGWKRVETFPYFILITRHFSNKMQWRDPSPTPPTPAHIVVWSIRFDFTNVPIRYRWHHEIKDSAG